jgi:hypothetical protein
LRGWESGDICEALDLEGLCCAEELGEVLLGDLDDAVVHEVEE